MFTRSATVRSSHVRRQRRYVIDGNASLSCWPGRPGQPGRRSGATYFFFLFFFLSFFDFFAMVDHLQGVDDSSDSTAKFPMNKGFPEDFHETTVTPPLSTVDFHRAPRRLYVWRIMAVTCDRIFDTVIVK
ncbi:hypothetical protein ABT297_41970 [Dactylosporangium sp. NPDC000555]|uniref:hypothetical protein n=1 Tax=Dactylosporangium sp. NPDC000555 TaxID=3154260 RepID=UPI0033318CEA